MSEEVAATAPEGAEGVQPTVDEVDGGGLPSAQADPEKLQFSEEFLNENIKNGKIMGRFESADDLAKTLKSIEDKYANVMRDKSNKEKQQLEQQQEQEQQAATQQVQVDTINELLPEFVDNGMQLTQEMEEKLEATGLDIRDVKLAAFDLKERVEKAHSVVGGKEEYQAMIEWGRENMTEEQKKAFDKDVTGNMSEYAIKGLYADYKANENNAPRLSGSNNAGNTFAGYKTRAELFADREYLSTPAGRSDKAARALHERRIAATPDDVIFGR